MMSVPFIQGTMQPADQQAVLRDVRQQVQDLLLPSIGALFATMLDLEVTAKLQRERRAPCVVGPRPRVIEWRCHHCGNTDARQMIRDGHYRRQLVTLWGVVPNLCVPMVECQRCGHDVVAQYVLLAKHDRFWLDAGEHAYHGSGLAQSLRVLAADWETALGLPSSPTTIAQRLLLLEEQERAAHRTPITDVPPIVQCDGIWFSYHPQALDTPARAVPATPERGRNTVLFVALGLWPDGRRAILDWEIAQEEDYASWERLLSRLWERGVRLETGLAVIVRDGGGAAGQR